MGYDLWVGLPSRTITAEQFYHYVRVQFGVEMEVRHINKKFERATSERNFCFIRCKTEEDMDHLFKEMDDATIGDWTDPIRVQKQIDKNVVKVAAEPPDPEK